MLDAGMKTQLKAYLVNLRVPIKLVAYSDNGAKSHEMVDLLEDVVAASDKVSLTVKQPANGERVPSFDIVRTGSPEVAATFAGLPMGHEFTSLVLALLWVGGHPPKVEAETIEAVKALDIDGELRFETYFSLSCQNCPDVVQALNLMSVLNPKIKHVAIDGALFQAEVEARQVMAVPSIYLNGEVFGQGRMGLEEILAKIDTGAQA
ncbi:MAG: alkyl hydroperoxide reductase subunit F, partial [Asticcacaulis sp. 32-58-5]